jgi:PAS domain S-box-containing protein
MAFQDLPIRRKVMAVMMLTSVIVLALTAAVFMVYDWFSQRQSMARSLAVNASIIADESTAALLFGDEARAAEILGRLKRLPDIRAAALYDGEGKMLAHYPPQESTNSFPRRPEKAGRHFAGGYLVVFQAAYEGEKLTGTLYLKSDLEALYERLRAYALTALLILCCSALAALGISSRLQRRITGPIGALAEAAKAVSQRGDYSVRAQKVSGDELGLLTDAFNLMLARIQAQTVELQESEERLRLALEASRTGTWDWTRASNKLAWDVNSHRMFGLQPGTFAGTYEAFLALVHPEDRQRVEYDVAQALEKKTEYRTGFRVVWPDGSVHYLASRGRGLYDAQGEVVRMSGVTLDETESQRAERTVRESEARKSAILESALDCIITMDQAGRIVDFNPAAEKTFGRRRAEVMGRTVAETIIPPRLRGAHQEGLARFHDTGQGPVLGKRLEMPAIRADGSEFPVELAISATRLEGGSFFFTAYLRDITERKRAEERLSLLGAIVESSDDAVIGKDLESQVVSWNAGAERMFGYSAAEMVGQPITRLLSPDRPGEEARIMAEVRQGEIRHLETVRIRKDGQPIEVSLTVSPIKNASGEILGISSIARDITERKRADRELHESRVRLSGVIGSAMDAIISVDSRQRVTIFNHAAERMFGCSAAEAVGEPLDRFIPARFRQAHRGHIEAFGQTGVTSRAMGSLSPLAGLRDNGEEFPIEASISQIEVAGQKIYTVILRDITERRRAQEALERNSAELREQAQMLDLANLMARDLEGRIILWNTGMETMYGWSRAEAMGKVAHELLHTRFPQPLETIRATLLSQGHWEGELLHLRKDGQAIFVASQWVLHRDAKDQPAAILEVNNDVTERKQAEQRQAAFARLGRSLSEAASAASAARVIADTADELIGWDAYSLDLYTAAEGLVHPVINIDTVEGKHVDVPPAYTGQAPSPVMQRVLEEGGQLFLRQAPYDFSPEAVPFGNTGRPSASLMYVPVRLGETPIGILSVQSYRPKAYTEQDLATLQMLADQCAGALERVRAEEKVRQLNEQLEQRVQERTSELIAANQELEAFTYSVAHDLRAPLRHIDAFTRILHEDFAAELPPEAQRYLENIRHGSHNMSHLVDDLLNLARVGRQELRRQPTSLDDLVHDVLEDLKREAEGRRIEWRIHPLPTVACDAGLMKQVFVNLLANAVKYTRPREVAVVEVGCQPQDGERAVVIRDNGVGFSMKYADKLFGVFQRLHRAEEFEGTGVGLATVARIIRKHGGRVWAEAEVDKGAAFYFTMAGLDNEAKTE